jgi:hypothetical protein
VTPQEAQRQPVPTGPSQSQSEGSEGEVITLAADSRVRPHEKVEINFGYGVLSRTFITSAGRYTFSQDQSHCDSLVYFCNLRLNPQRCLKVVGLEACLQQSDLRGKLT